MKMNELYESFGNDTLSMEQAIFSSIFILQNRMQTAGEKLQEGISMKQWLLITMTACCPEPRTLTSVGELMGCSRQNVKKLAAALEEKGFVRMVQGVNNSVELELTDKVEEYSRHLGGNPEMALELLFSKLSEKEIKQLFRLYAKLYEGMEQVEQYARLEAKVKYYGDDVFGV